MAIKVNGQVTIGDNRRGRFKSLNPGTFANAPASAEVGDFYYNTTDQKIYAWTGTEWK